jgi:hypothetical protein
VDGEKDLKAIAMVFFLNSTFNDFKERYWKLKEREIRKFNKAKKRLEKLKKKILKKKEKREAKLKKKEEKLASKKAKKQEENPFDVNDNEDNELQGMDVGKDEKLNISDESSEEDEESSDSSESQESCNDSDSDGLHVPKSMHELDIQKAEKERVKNIKRKEKEYKKKMNEKSRSSKISSNKANNSGGFLRNSVLVQKTLNFFGRRSKPLLVKDTDHEESDQKVEDIDKRNSDLSPQINEYFVETADKASKNAKHKDSFENATKEIDVDYFKNEHPESFKDKENQNYENEDDNDGEEKQIFNYMQKDKTGLPPLHKSKSKGNRKGSGIKKLVAPPKPKNDLRKSVVEKVDLLDLLEAN